MALRLVAVIFSGLLLAAAFPKWDQSYLLAVALIPLFWGIEGQTPKRAFWLGLAGGLAFYVGLLYWIFFVCHVYGGLPVAAAVAVMLLLSGYLALYRGVWAWGVSRGAARGLAPLWWGPVLWVTLELIQTYLLSGFPWELLGYGLYRNPFFVQFADLTGVYGLSFLLVILNFCLYRLIFPGRSSRLSYSVLALLILLLWGGYGFFRLNAVERQIAQSPKMKVAVVQGNIEQGQKWDPANLLATINKYDALTRKVSLDKPHLIVWPETAAPFWFIRDKEFSAQLRQMARESQANLLFGSPAMEFTGEGQRQLFNRAYLLSPHGEVVGYYDKAHLTPYGEYVPLQRIFFFIPKMVPMIGDFAEGPAGMVLPLPEGSVGPLICFESIFGEIARAQVKNGAQLLVNITNDAWFGTTSAPYQHLSMAVLRAVENRVSLARAANTGISAFIAPDGRLLWTSELNIPEAKSWDLPWLPGGTLYTKIGDSFAYACALLTAMGLLWGWRRKK
jgi:apolipoprotein N-acyltransferase